jgi:Fe2+ transport system protein FeoA
MRLHACGHINRTFLRNLPECCLISNGFQLIVYDEYHILHEKGLLKILISMIKISELKINTLGTVVDITAEPLLRERLLELGLAPGRTLKVLINNLPFSGPIIVLAGSLTVALRHNEADSVWVEA